MDCTRFLKYCKYQVPDGGYGWVIVFASFMCNLIVDGIANCFGVFLPKYVEAFGAGKGSVAWAGSLLCGVYLCVGMFLHFVAFLTDLYLERNEEEIAHEVGLYFD